MAAPVSNIEDVLVDCRSVWKVFGNQAPAAMRAIAERGLGKREVLQEFGCVVGVSDATLEVRRGEIFCIMGLSGSGKSTLIRMLNRLIEPTSGEVLVKGRDIAKLGAADLREMRAKHIAMVFQSVALLPYRTVLENAAFGLEVQGVPRAERNAAAEESLRKVGLGDWMDRYPRELSGGMQQRVGLARALTADPEIILMDEPFSALDAQLAGQMRTQVRRVVEAMGQTVMFVTHDIDESLLMSDRVVVLGVPGARVVGEVVVPFGNDRDAEAVRVTDGYLTLRAELHALLEAAYPARAGTEEDEPATAGPARRT